MHHIFSILDDDELFWTRQSSSTRQSSRHILWWKIGGNPSPQDLASWGRSRLARRGGEKYAGDGQTAFLKEEGNRTYDRGLNLFPLHQLTKVYGDNIERCLSMRQ
jgi:hypothetical protein